MEGIVYVLKNPAFTNLVKIGITTRDEVHVRMSELYTTGVPLPFECVYAGKVDDPKKVEAALHHAFSNTRVNPSRIWQLYGN
ncbi:MAG: GIY-YIG nuclease family protein [Flavobacteriaceae bacterium]|nr:GIY-YIG nuclease family protein [Flavobacteriaceae bacterium]